MAAAGCPIIARVMHFVRMQMLTISMMILQISAVAAANIALLSFQYSMPVGP